MCCSSVLFPRRVLFFFAGQVVGTHSLLSRKVEFPNLGLLVIDEEQKFGVNQKEKLKVKERRRVWEGLVCRARLSPMLCCWTVDQSDELSLCKSPPTSYPLPLFDL